MMCPTCGNRATPRPPRTALEKYAARVESDHTPEAFSPPTTQGEDNLTQPKGSGEQPTSVEKQLDMIVLMPASWEYDDYQEAKTSLLSLVEEERRQAKIEELEELITTSEGDFSWMLLYPAHQREFLQDRLTKLRGENNE